MDRILKIFKKTDAGTVFEMTGIISIGFLVFTVIMNNVGFVFRVPVTGLTLPFSLVIYVALLIAGYLIYRPGRIREGSFAAAVSAFLVLFVILAYVSVTYFANSYDTSWDGEGYHSNAVISFAQGWNPVYQKELPLKFPDASIFVKGYPKALWLIQSNIYLTAGDFDAAKVTNLAAVIIAFIFAYSFCRKLRFSAPVSVLIALPVVLHPPLLNQFLSFSEDFFSYEMVIAAASAFGMMCAEKSINKNLLGFALAEMMLLGSKFSNLPIVAALGALFLIFYVLVKIDDTGDRINWLLVGMLAVCTFLFAFIPYLTNTFNYKHPFYPSNYESVNRTFRQDNVPLNLWYSNNALLLVYSIYSRSQTKPMGKGDPKNIAQLKVPFTFSGEEIEQEATIYNNRVGAGGPLFSGVFSIAMLLSALMFIRRKGTGEHANLYYGAFAGSVAICIILALVNPVPNLLRYNVQIILIPPVVLIFALLRYRNSKLIRSGAYIMLFFMVVNAALFTRGVILRNNKEQSLINRQLAELKDPAYKNIVWANNFYSNYLRLDEAQIPYSVNKGAGCKDMKFLAYSSYTTRICRIKQ